jgi:competence protein ComEC
LAMYLPESVRTIKPDNEDWQEVWQRAQQKVGEIDYLARGNQLETGSDSFLVLWPDYSTKVLGINSNKPDYNNSALGVLAQVKQKQILLLSDLDLYPAERAIEKLNLSVDIFKINHHGSKYGTSQRLLELADPGLVVISAGKNNWHGHPHEEVIQLLESLNIPVKRTDINGKIVVPL